MAADRNINLHYTMVGRVLSSNLLKLIRTHHLLLYHILGNELSRIIPKCQTNRPVFIYNGLYYCCSFILISSDNNFNSCNKF